MFRTEGSVVSERADATRCARERSARWVLPVNERVDVSRARTMMHGGWHARRGARRQGHVTSAYELRIYDISQAYIYRL
jgi:hypothetical protein